MKRTIVLLLLLPCILLCSAQSKNNSRKKGYNKKIVTLEEVTKKVNELFDATFDVVNPAVTYDSTKVVIAEYTKKQKQTLIQELQDQYYESFFQACDNNQLDSAIIGAFKYLIVDGSKDEDDMLTVLVDNFGSDGDTENTKFLIQLFNIVSDRHDGVYKEIIDSLSVKYDDVIHPIPFEEMVRGYWVSISDSHETMRIFGMDVPINGNNMPEYILSIKDALTDSGTLMLSSPRTPWRAEKTSTYWYYSPSYTNYMMRNSQSTFCDANTKELNFTFASEKIKEGNTDVARKKLAENRQMKAELDGMINSSDFNFGERLAAGVITDVTKNLLDTWAMNMAAGSVTSEAYRIETKTISPKVMDSNIIYKRVKASSKGYNTTQDDQNLQQRFVKWEESDSVIFISPKGKPVFIGSLSKDSPLLNDYYNIRKKYNFWKPQYVLPTLASLGIGTIMMVNGMSSLLSVDKNKYTEKENDKKIKKGVIQFLLGDVIATAGICIVTSEISSKRQKAYNKINKENLNKMRQKAAQFSMRPNLDIIDNSIGMDLTLSF